MSFNLRFGEANASHLTMGRGGGGAAGGGLTN